MRVSVQALFHDTGFRRGLQFGTLPLALIAIILGSLYVYNSVTADERSIAFNRQLEGDSGPDFLLEGQPVEIVFKVKPLRAKLGDSVAIRMGIRKLVLSPKYDTGGLANETNGTFSPVLSVPSDCGSPSNGRTFSTKTPPQYLSWDWTIDCGTAGDKEFDVALDYNDIPLLVPAVQAPPGGVPSPSQPAPTAFRKSFGVSFYRPMWEVLGGFASAVFLGACRANCNLLSSQA